MKKFMVVGIEPKIYFISSTIIKNYNFIYFLIKFNFERFRVKDINAFFREGFGSKMELDE